MAASRFAVTNENLLEQLKANATNSNTKKSTKTWLNVWKRWALERGVNPKLQEIEPEELDKHLQRFYAEIRMTDGEHYEPDSLKIMRAALDRHLKENGYTFSITKNREFHQANLVLEGKAKQLRQEGKGKRPNASTALSAEEEENLWASQKLGNQTPRVLSQTMWWILTQHFGLRGRQEHHSMSVEDFIFSLDDNGVEYLTFKEGPTKTRQGGLNTKRRSVLPKMFVTGGPRCPVHLFKEYLSRRPSEFYNTGPFYLACIDNPQTGVWYKKQRLGINSIDSMMKNIIKNSTVKSTKNLTNHSARKTLVKKLRTANVERQSIIQVTGHASEKSLDDYDEGNEQEQRVLSNIISKHQSAANSNNSSLPPACSDQSSTAGNFTTASFPASLAQQSGQAVTVNNFQNCQVTFNVCQGKSSSPRFIKKQYKRVRVLDSDSDSE